MANETEPPNVYSGAYNPTFTNGIGAIGAIRIVTNDNKICTSDINELRVEVAKARDDFLLHTHHYTDSIGSC